MSKNSAIIFIFITVLVDMIGIGLIIPIIPDLLESLTGDSNADVAVIGGLLITAYALTQFLFAPVLGEFSDRYGRKPILLLALFGLGIDYLIHAYSPTVGWLFFGRIVAGVFGASHTVAFAYIADISKKEDKAKNFGLIGAAFGLGFVIGPGIGGILGEYYGVRSPFFLAAGFSLLNFLFGLFFVKESLVKEKRRKINFSRMIPFVSLVHLSKYKAVLGFIFAFVFVQFAGQVMPSTWSFFTKGAFNWDKADIGLSLVVVGLLVSAVQGFLTGRLVKAYGNRKVIMLGFIGWTTGMFLISFAQSELLLYLALIPYVVGGIAGPTIQGLVSNHVGESEQGNLQGVLVSFGSLAAVIGPSIYTGLFGYYSSESAPIYFPGAPFFLGGMILVIATIIAAWSLKSIPRIQKKVKSDNLTTKEDL